MSSKRSRIHPKYKTRYRVRNWASYDRALVHRGDLTIWFHDDAIASWEPDPSGARGRPHRYSSLAIETAVTLRLVYKLPWRQTEGLLGSLMRMLGLELSVPDHTTLSRRARCCRVSVFPRDQSGALELVVDATGLKVFGQGEWAAWKHGSRKTGPGWRKLHIGVDENGTIVAGALSDAGTADASVVPQLLNQVDTPISRFTADGAYDRRAVYEAVLRAGVAPRLVVPPIRTAVVAGPSEPLLGQRDEAIETISQVGRREWKKSSGYHRQAKAENAFFRYKQVVGRRLRARTGQGQNMEVRVACDVLNRMASLGMPKSMAVVVG